ncbi:MAG: hypothetical protein HY246_23075 [Proteobacteria bacterium]|nr:hypothetical protein [Pseudomonadota bacterium]
MQPRFPSGRLVVAVLLASVALWAVMVFGTLAHLRALAGGLDPFDVRPFGYSAAEAEDLLAALGREGRRFYARVQLRLDTVYPMTYVLSRGLLMWWLTKPARLGQLEVPFGGRVALVGLPLVAMIFDYWENACIAAMLATGAAAKLVATASAATQVKSLAGALTEVIAIGLAGIALYARWRGRPGA